MTHSPAPAAASGWRARLRVWLRPPRRLRPRRGGVILVVGVLSLGLATLNTGNNLLYLLVGALLGLITLSGWLSEQTVSGFRVVRQPPFGGTAGEPVRIEYRVENQRRRLPTAGLELRDVELLRDGRVVRPTILEPAYLGLVPPGESAMAAEVLVFPRRGVYRFHRLVLATSYPFGLFLKERDLTYPGTLVVWPRTDLPVPELRVGGQDRGNLVPVPALLPGSGRGEYRGLRSYRPGDDPRDIHWRTTARRAEPIVREYDREQGESWWIVLDLDSPDEAAGEAAIELAASLAAASAARGVRFGLAAGQALLRPSAGGPPRLEAALDLLAQVRLGDPGPLLPAPARECVLVTARTTAGAGYAAVLRPGPAGGAA